jgi:hypothetical protein
MRIGICCHGRLLSADFFNGWFGRTHGFASALSSIDLGQRKNLPGKAQRNVCWKCIGVLDQCKEL